MRVETGVEFFEISMQIFDDEIAKKWIPVYNLSCIRIK